MRNYIGLTIGPIIEVLQSAKKTRELWTGSYLFSFLMKIMVGNLTKKGYDFLSPVVDDKSVGQKHGVGLFHDRFIAMSELSQACIESDVNAAIDKAKEELALVIVNIKPDQLQREKEVRAFLDQFLQISYIITPLPDECNIFTEINKLLDNAELQRSFVSSPAFYENFVFYRDNKPESVNPIAYLQARTNQSAFIRDAFGDKHGKGFPSIAEISGRDLNIVCNKDDEDDDPFPKGCKLKYKYAALIQADGDNIGTLVKSVGKDPEKAKAFSKKLFDFAARVPQIAEKYGAQVVYAGGDDILSFAPVVYREYTVFDYLDDLNNCFKAAFGDEAENISLSFGVAAVYHKYPLYEALEQARNNLFGAAKNFTLKGKKPKNTIAFELSKHSGQCMRNIFLQSDSTVYAPFKALLKSELNVVTTIPHSLHHNLKRSEKVIAVLSEKKDFDQRLEQFFKNNFNEPEHEKNQVQEGLKLARELLVGYFDFYNGEKESNEIFAEFFSALAIIKHLRGDR